MLLAYEHRSTTQMNTEDLVLWRAAGLRVAMAEIEPVQNSTSIAVNLNAVDKALSEPIHSTKAKEEDDACRSLIWILAKAMNYFAQIHKVNEHHTNSENFGQTTNWEDLRTLLDKWHNTLPLLFQPYASLPFTETPSHQINRNTTYQEKDSTFTQHLFSIPMCAVATQFYHFAQLLLLLNHPVGDETKGANRLRIFRKIAQESDYYYKQICGIALGMRKSTSSSSRAAREHMVQPLYAAGLCLEDEPEQRLVLNLLEEVLDSAKCTVSERPRELLSAWGRQA